MKIYTRTGDDGNTSLAGGRRIPKYDIRIEASGSVDELLSWIGLLRSFSETDRYHETLIHIQDILMRTTAFLADEKGDYNKYFEKDDNYVSYLEKEIDKLDSTLPAIGNFIIPGGNLLVSYCHIARCVCRRSERSVLRLNSTERIPSLVYVFLNRLSDYLFLLSRVISQSVNNEEIEWNI